VVPPIGPCKFPSSVLEICKGFFDGTEQFVPSYRIMIHEQQQRSLEFLMHPTRIVAGRAIADFAREKKKEYATTINGQLKQHPTRMRQIPIEDLETSMNEGRFVFALGLEQTLLACAQIWPLPGDPSVIECGTWLRFTREPKGTGAMVLTEAAKLARALPETQMVIALVEEENGLAQTVLQNLGGELIGKRPSDYVIASKGQPATMSVFNIMKLGGK